MCFSPQRRAIFRHRKYKKCFEPDVFCAFSVKFALRHSGVRFFDIASTKSASDLTFFVHFHFKMCFLPQRRAIFDFSSDHMNDSAPAALTGLLFDWPDARIIEKTQHFATSLTFGADVSSFFWLSRYCIFFLLTWLLYSAFQLSILSS